jgi:hypothetical protein
MVDVDESLRECLGELSLCVLENVGWKRRCVVLQESCIGVTIYPGHKWFWHGRIGKRFDS